MEIEGISGLQFFDTDFKYDNKRFLYSKTNHVDFSATVTKNSINGIPTGSTYDVNFGVSHEDQYINFNLQKNWMGNINKKGMQAAQQASSIIEEITFTKRVATYENSISERGFFNYNDVQFHRNGDIFKSGRFLYNIRSQDISISLQVFYLHITKNDKNLKEKFKSIISSDDLQINISRDRDCFLYMFNILYGLSWKNFPIRTKKVDRHELFYTTVLRFGAMLSKADGHADPGELTQLKSFFQIEKNQIPNAGRIFNEELNNNSNISDIFKVFSKEFKDSNELKESFLLGMISVALSDGKFDIQEYELLNQVASALEIRESNFWKVMASAGLSPKNIFGNSNYDHRSGYQKTNNNNERGLHLKIMGLNGEESVEEIRDIYRILVKKYHPDVLRGQGMPEQELEKANRLLAQINKSYEYLMSERQA